MDKGYKDNLQKFKEIFKKNILKIIFIISMSGFLFTYIMNYIKLNIVPNLIDLKDPSLIEKLNKIDIGPPTTFEVIIMMTSIILFIIGSLMLSESKKIIGFSIALGTIILIFQWVAIIDLVISRNVTLYFMVASYISIIYVTFIMGEFLNSLNVWMRTGNNNQYDVAKLTFIWVVIIFVLNAVF